MFRSVLYRLSGFVLLTVTLSAALAAYRQNTPARLTFDVEVTGLELSGAPWLRLEYERPNGSWVALEQTLLSTRAGEPAAHWRLLSTLWHPCKRPDVRLPTVSLARFPARSSTS